MNKSTCFNILLTLASAQLVSKHPRFPVYGLGPRLIELGAASRSRLSGHQQLREQVRRLVDDIELTCLIGQPLADNSGVVVVDRVVPERAGALSAPVGHVYPLSGPAMGHAVLAARDQHEALELGRQLRMFPIGGEEDFLSALRDIRRLGYAVSAGAWDAAVNAVAATVDPVDALSTVLCVIGHQEHLPETEFARIGSRLQDVAGLLRTRADVMVS
jgi:DNA-binding IclR family transcriptional regulator